MTARPRFLQIHSLNAYTGALLNRDNTGLSKRMLYGGASRIRISSQSLKRHWRFADDPHSLYSIPGVTDDFRSRSIVTIKVIEPLRDDVPPDIVDALEPEIQMAVYGPKGGDTATRQTLLLGAPEIGWLAGEARRLASEAVEAGGTDLELAATVARNKARAWRQAFKANFQSMRDTAILPAGVAGALFGRMVTSDPGANIAAAIHVAHAFTAHAEETEIDYFSAVDDLAQERNQADFADETEVSSGLFCGCVAVDLNGLLSNLAGHVLLAGAILHNLTYLIAEISLGAKLGSAAPYGRAALMRLEAGSRQPRSLAEAYRSPCPPQVSDKRVERLWRREGVRRKRHWSGRRAERCQPNSRSGADFGSVTAPASGCAPSGRTMSGPTTLCITGRMMAGPSACSTSRTSSPARAWRSGSGASSPRSTSSTC